MKIALIEDRKIRLERFVKFDLDFYKSLDIITGITFNDLMADLEKGITSRLDAYGCVAVHRSALANTIKSEIINYCNKHKKPLIYFSGGITASSYKEIGFPFLYINAREFYSLNLKLFLDDFQQNNIPNLLLIQFGNKWKTSLLLQIRQNIVMAQNNEQLLKENSAIDDGDVKLIDSISDLRLNAALISDLQKSSIHDLLQQNASASLTPQQLADIKTAIDHLLIELI